MKRATMDIEGIRAMVAAGHGNKAIAAAIGSTRESIASAMRKHGIKRSAEHIATLRRMAPITAKLRNSRGMAPDGPRISGRSIEAAGWLLALWNTREDAR